MKKSTLTLRLDPDQAKLIERLKEETKCATATTALIEAADIVVNRLPHLIVERDKYRSEAQMWNERFEMLIALLQQESDIEKKINEILSVPQSMSQ